MECLEQALRCRQILFWYANGFLTISVEHLQYLQGFVDCYNRIYSSYKLDFIVDREVIRVIEE